jgi:hypothetical protein
MKLYLVREQALKRYKISPKELDELIDKHKLNLIMVVACQNEEVAIYDDDLAAYVAERDISPDKFDHLRGNLLGLNEAGLRYGVASSVMSGWVSQGLLKIKGYGERNKKLVDEADVAFIVELGRAKKMRPGKKPFS